MYLFAFFFLSVLGTLLHFFYDWCAGALPAALISPVNESVWEHMKLLYFPFLVFLPLYYPYWNKKQKILYPQAALPGSPLLFLAQASLSVTMGLLTIPIIFYVYSGLLGFSLVWVDILIFYLAVLVTVVLLRRLLFRQTPSCLRSFCCLYQKKSPSKGALLPAAFLLILWLLCFLWFTFMPPPLALFQSP